MFFKEKLQDLSDEVLISRYRKSGKSKWVGELYNRYAHLVLGVCLGYFKNKPEAEDAQSHIFEKLLTDLKTKEVQKFSAWLYVVAKNHCLMELRKRQPFVSRYPKEPVEEPMEELLDTEQTLVALEEAIDDLKPEQQFCVRMFYLERKSYKDIAETSSYSMNEVKSHIQNGKRNLGLAMKRKAEQ